jgi:hypothetical protein
MWYIAIPVHARSSKMTGLLSPNQQSDHQLSPLAGETIDPRVMSNVTQLIQKTTLDCWTAYNRDRTTQATCCSANEPEEQSFGSVSCHMSPWRSVYCRVRLKPRAGNQLTCFPERRDTLRDETLSHFGHCVATACDFKIFLSVCHYSSSNFALYSQSATIISLLLTMLSIVMWWHWNRFQPWTPCSIAYIPFSLSFGALIM